MQQAIAGDDFIGRGSPGAASAFENCHCFTPLAHAIH
jgi:hypothetical protein